MTVIHSRFQYGNKEWGNPSEAVCFWGFHCMCQHWGKQPTLWPGSQGGLGSTHTHTDTHTVVNTFLPACMKGLFRPAVPLQAQLWSLTLFRENISFTLWCLLVYKKANLTLKIACLKQRKDEANTLWDTDARENHLYFPFRSHDHLVILRHCWFEGRNRSEKKSSFTFAVCFPSAQMRHIISIRLYCFGHVNRFLSSLSLVLHPTRDYHISLSDAVCSGIIAAFTLTSWQMKKSLNSM